MVIVPSLTECGCGEVIAGLQQTLRGEGYQIMLGMPSTSNSRRRAC